MEPQQDNSPNPSPPPAPPPLPSERPQAPAAAQPKIALRPVYPKPPAFFKHFLLLCIRPESWAEAARYPIWRTLLLAFFAAILASLLSTISISAKFHKVYADFANTYDAKFPPLKIDADGKLLPQGEFKQPIFLQIPRLFPTAASSLLIIDPTDKTDPRSSAAARVTVIGSENVRIWDRPTEKEITIKNKDFQQNFFLLFGTPGPYTIDGTFLKSRLQFPQILLPLLYAATFAAIKLFLESAWVLLIIFITGPLIIMAAASGARGIPTPRRIAHRMAAALCVPLVLIGGILQAADYHLADVAGPQGSQFIWILAAVAMAVWTGFLAKSIFNPAPTR